VLLAAVCKSPGHACNDAEVIELLSFRHKSILAGDLNAKYPLSNSAVSNLSGVKLLNLQHINEIEIWAPQCSTHYSPAGNGDVLDIIMHTNVQLSEVIVIVNCLENQFTSHDLCDENHEREVGTTVQALLASVDDTPFGKVRPCDIHKLVKTLKLRKACGLDGIPNECLRHLLRRLRVHLTHLFNHCLRLSHFPKSWKEAKFISLQKPGKDAQFPQDLRPISFLPITIKLFWK
jgi:hypothetical protein